MSRAAVFAFAVIFACAFATCFATAAHAQFSGGFEGKWDHHVVMVDRGGDAPTPIVDLWTDGERLAWRSRDALHRADLDRALTWRVGKPVAGPPADAWISEGSKRAIEAPSDSAPAHMLIEDGVVSALVELHLDPGCTKYCGLAGLDVVELAGRAFHPEAAAVASLPPGGAFPIDSGDLRWSWR